jgi:hypothetical protein
MSKKTPPTIELVFNPGSIAWLQLHRASEEAASDASLQKSKAKAKELYARAARLEEGALKALDTGKDVTRSITAASAAAPWLKAGRPNKAEAAAIDALNDESTTDYCRAELRKILETILTGKEPHA